MNCTACGLTADTDWAFCRRCGASLRNSLATQVAQTAASNGSTAAGANLFERTVVAQPDQSLVNDLVGGDLGNVPTLPAQRTELLDLLGAGSENTIIPLAPRATRRWS